MDIDWSKAPEGATHFDPTDEHTDSCWMMMIARKAWCYFNGGEWESVDYDDIAHDIAEYVPCPTKPSAPEWDGQSVKEVGMKFQCSLGECELMAIDSNKVTCCVKFLADGHLQFCSLDALEPLRTKEQRERDELVEHLSDAMYEIKFSFSFADAKSIADALIAAGYRKERDK